MENLTHSRHLALEEYKILEQRVDNTESALNKWENAHLITNGLIATIIAQALNSPLSGVKLFVCVTLLSLIAGFISRQWAKLTGRAILYLIAYEKRQWALETILKYHINSETANQPTTIFATRESTLAEFEATRKTWINNSCTFKTRQGLPIVIMRIWISISFISVGLVANCIWLHFHL